MSRATQMERIITKGQLVPLIFTQADVPASQTNAALALATGGDGYAMPWDFEVVGVSVRSNAARTGGSLTVEPLIDGVATGLTAVLDATNTQQHKASLARGSKVGSAGGVVTARATSAGTWAPITADVVVTVWAIAHLEGI